VVKDNPPGFLDSEDVAVLDRAVRREAKFVMNAFGE